MISTSVVGQNLQDGKYIIKQELGEGGFGCTYKATDKILNQPVVIKTIKSGSKQNISVSDVKKEFLNEAYRLIQCYHPNIVQFYEFFSENDIPYMVMEYLPGKSLDKIVLPNNPLSEFTAVSYIRQIGQALKVVHDNNLLHRDIKPQNLILRKDNQQVVLIDFGIAREVSWGSIQAKKNFVSDGYAPIEQYLPQAKRTPGTDIYGLAATLYTLVTAQIPVSATLRKRLPLDNPQKIRPGLSDEISQAIMKGMELELEERPKSVDEWLTFLPQTDGNHGVITKAKFFVNNTNQKLVNSSVIHKIKVLSYSKQLWGVFIAFTGLLLGLDYAWLRFQSFSENKEVRINSTKQLNKTTPINNNSSEFNRVPDVFVSPNQSKELTPINNNSFEAPEESTEKNVQIKSGFLEENVSNDENKKQSNNTIIAMITIKIVYLKTLIILKIAEKYILNR